MVVARDVARFVVRSRKLKSRNPADEAAILLALVLHQVIRPSGAV
jgi:hypothetical protein